MSFKKIGAPIYEHRNPRKIPLQITTPFIPVEHFPLNRVRFQEVHRAFREIVSDLGIQHLLRWQCPDDEANHDSDKYRVEDSSFLTGNMGTNSSQSRSEDRRQHQSRR